MHTEKVHTQADVALAVSSAFVRTRADRPPTFAAILNALTAQGYTAELAGNRRSDEGSDPQEWRDREGRNIRSQLILSSLLALPSILAHLPSPVTYKLKTSILGGRISVGSCLGFLQATCVLLLLGPRFAKSAWMSLRAGAANMDVLILLGVCLALRLLSNLGCTLHCLFGCCCTLMLQVWIFQL